jgi:DNA-directed RNA polymerase specialized sigma24 family protein
MLYKNNLPTAYPLSEFEPDDDNKGYQFGDDGLEVEHTYSKLASDILTLRIISQLNDKYRVVFMFLLLRGAGYDLTHDECAKSISISRQAYMKLVKTTRERVSKIIQGKTI